ncbi:MAG: type II toxin-antitoxin system VapC family toxin [Dermatophilaceae bacterium]|nr:type II toxin-antitoxin system VapC family toxin [Dermatophilaceae bacterium]
MIIDASVAVDAVTDPGERGQAARTFLAQLPVGERLHAPGHFAIEVLSALGAIARRPSTGFSEDDIDAALVTLGALGIDIDPTTWADVTRAWTLSAGSVRYSDAIYLAAAERHREAVVTSDSRLARSGAAVSCATLTP